MSDNSYTYERLDLGTDAIRLLRLLKGDRGPILCELFETYLDQAQGSPYEALSYTWGTAPAGFSITVNTHSVKVTNSLHTALQYLRYPHKDRILWIDAICIDQDHHAEKSHQVGQMRLIYKYADNVIIWLGMGDEGHGPFTSLFTLMDSLDKQAIARPDYRRNSLPHLEREWEKLSTHFNLDDIGRLQRTLDELLRRSWFQRVWVIQEVASARSATIVCGDSMVSTRILVAMPYLLKLGTVDAHTQAVLDIMPGHLRQHSWWSKDPDICTLLKKFGRCEASNELDRFYALFGISSDLCKNSVLRPDYEITLHRALQRMISYLLFGKVIEHPSVSFPDWDLDHFFRVLDSLSRHVLLWAVNIWNEPIISRILAREANPSKHQDINVNIRDINGQTILILAAMKGHEQITRLLLGYKDISINSVNTRDETALSLAAENGHAPVVQLLLGHKYIRVNTVDRLGNTPLMFAAMYGHKAAVQLLLDHKDIRIYTMNLRRDTPLGMAAMRGHKAIVQAFLGHKDISLSINYQNRQGKTPLMLAASHGHTSVLQILLSHKDIAINKRDKNWISALMLAAMHSHEPAVHVLLSQDGIHTSYKNISKHARSGVTVSKPPSHILELIHARHLEDVNRQTKGTKIPSTLTTKKDDQPSLRPPILTDYMDIDHQSSDEDEDTALDLALAEGDITTVKQLLAHEGLHLNFRSPAGEAVLKVAVKRDCYEAVDLILQRWGILAVSARQDEPVSFAASTSESSKRQLASSLLGNKTLQLAWTTKNYEHMLKLLVEYGMDAQSKDGYANGQRLLERAAKENMTGMIQVLLKNNVDVNAKDEFGDATAIWYAALRGHTASVNLLLKAGADIGVKSSSGYTPLEIAIRGGYFETAKAIIDHIPRSKQSAVDANSSASWGELASDGQNKRQARVNDIT